MSNVPGSGLLMVAPGMHEITDCWLKLANGRKVEGPEVATRAQNSN